MPMERFRLVLKFSLLAGALLLILIFFFWNTSELTGNDLNQGGKAHYDYAPDGQYKAMRIYFQDEIVSFQMVLDKNDEVIYVARLWDSDAYILTTIWVNREDKLDVAYDYVAVSYDNNIHLPVPFYERWYAWLFMTVRNVDLDKLEMIPD